jgi:hypothetical protein
MAISTSHHTYLHILGPHAKFGGISTLRISVYGETLGRGTRAVYPFDQHPTKVDQ